jgi:hypothetical protein
MGAQRPQAATRAREGLTGAWVGASLAGGAVVVAVLRPFWPKNGEQLSFCAQTEQLASAQVKGTKEHPTPLRNAGAPLETLPSRAGLQLASVVPRALGCEA